MAVERVGDVLASIAEEDGGGGDEGDRRQQVGELAIEVREHDRRLRRRNGQDHGGRRGARAIGHPQRQAGAGAGHGSDGGLRPQRCRRQRRHQGLDERPEAGAERDEDAAEARGPRGRAGGRPGRGTKAAKEAAVARFDLRQPREGGPQRQALRVAGMDAGHQRLAEALDRLLTQTPPQERCDRLVAFAAARDHEVEGHAQLAAPGEEAGAEEGSDPARDAEHTFGQGVQPSPAEHVDRAWRAGRHEALAQSQVTAESDGVRLLGQDRVWAALEKKPLDALGADHSSPPRLLLEERERHARGREVMGGHQPRDAAADDGDGLSGHDERERGRRGRR